MRLPRRTEKQSLAEQLAEFDIWITPSLGEIRDTQRFKEELQRIAEVFDALADSTHQFRIIDECSPESIADALLRLLAGKSIGESTSILQSAASLLFLSTGKSDNNAKCQLPIHLRDASKWANFPVFRNVKKKPTLSTDSIPRVLPSEDYMALVARLHDDKEDQSRLLREFIRFVLSDSKYVAQLWSIGHSYSQLKAFKRERDLLTPLVIFQVRGSVSASGGHEPERKLRERFEEWGLIRDVDFNTADVVIDKTAGKGGRVKQRAYDFVLPFQTPGWSRRIFIQSQFYAGDSGSVSHKNVDQTTTSRSKAIDKTPDAIFVEYVDGAGYFSSLNGDLKTLLSMYDTYSFTQVRSAPIRLRLVLQEIGFLAPLEIEHAIARTDGSGAAVSTLLREDGYAVQEIGRAMECSIAARLIERSAGILKITDARRAIARRYFLLDAVALIGSSLSGGVGSSAGYLQVPGYGPLFGAKLNDVAAKVIETASGFADDFRKTETFVSDIQWLEECRFLVSS